jgi:hypothetical protein
MKRFLICLIPVVALCLPGDLKGETTIDRQVKRIVRQRDSNDTKIFKIERWVRDNIRFHTDNKQFNVDERWTMPTETFQRRKGDCEDGAILIMCFAVTAGVPEDRVRLYAPVVTPGGMHASVAYKRESDDQWVWVEWTLNRAHSLGDIAKRPVMKDVVFVPLGSFLEVTSLNPFHMKWLLDKEWQRTSQELLGDIVETGE